MIEGYSQNIWKKVSGSKFIVSALEIVRRFYIWKTVLFVAYCDETGNTQMQ